MMLCAFSNLSSNNFLYGLLSPVRLQDRKLELKCLILSDILFKAGLHSSKSTEPGSSLIRSATFEQKPTFAFLFKSPLYITCKHDLTFCPSSPHLKLISYRVSLLALSHSPAWAQPHPLTLSPERAFIVKSPLMRLANIQCIYSTCTLLSHYYSE